MTKREGESGDRERRGEKRKMATNEVLREIHNAASAALKDFSRGRCFSLWAPVEVWPGRVGEWWVSRRLGYEASPAGRTVQTTRA